MIEVKNLTRIFDHRGIAGLHGLNFSVKEGHILSVMGPNGSGKSTLLKILSNQILPDSGEVLFSNKFAFFPHDKILPEITVLEFLMTSVHSDIDKDKKNQLARDLADTFEFTFQLKQKLSELSSGQKQKVLLASELINRPQLLLMDEPFTHLDPLTRKDILKALFTFIRQQEITVIWVTHELDEALKFSDNILILNFGRIEHLSHPLEIVRQPRNLFVAQFIGYRNFFPVHFRENAWNSPWGNIQMPPMGNGNAILVVPDNAWEMRIDGLALKILSKYAGKQSLEYELEYSNQRIYFSRSPELPLIEDREISLYPILRQSFLIPL